MSSINKTDPLFSDCDNVNYLLDNCRYLDARERLFKVLKVCRDKHTLNTIFSRYLHSSIHDKTREIIRELVLKTGNTELINKFCKFIARGGINVFD